MTLTGVTWQQGGGIVATQSNPTGSGCGHITSHCSLSDRASSGRVRQQCVWRRGEEIPALISFLKQLLSRVRHLLLRSSAQWRTALQKLP